MSLPFFSHVHFQCNQLHEQRVFFKLLGFTCSDIIDLSFTVQLGRTKLQFSHAASKARYHYCILVSESQLASYQTTLSELNQPIIKDAGATIIHNDAWDSDSIYFFDGDDNIAEFIVHHDLPKQVSIQIAEIGIVSPTSQDISLQLGQSLDLKPFRSTNSRFIDCGFPGTMFIIVDPTQKEFWFPSKITPVPLPFSGIMQYENEQRTFTFDGQGIKN